MPAMPVDAETTVNSAEETRSVEILIMQLTARLPGNGFGQPHTTGFRN
jgi:hypothetical protein